MTNHHDVWHDWTQTPLPDIIPRCRLHSALSHRWQYNSEHYLNRKIDRLFRRNTTSQWKLFI